jgi:hypothetical protein
VVAFNVTLPPLQKVVGPDAVMITEGAVVTVTDTPADVVLQPFTMTVTVYVPASAAV